MEIQEIAKQIKLVILDVDGVLSDGCINISGDGELFKSFFVRDGLGIKFLQDAGIAGISALDVSIQAQVVNMLMKFQRELGLTYLFIAHDLSMVRHIADETAVMYLGTMVEYGPTEEVYGHPAHPYTQGLLSAVPVADPDYEKTHHRIPMEGEVPSPIDPKPGCRFCGRCPRATEQCRTQTPAPKDLSGGHFAACHHLD